MGLASKGSFELVVCMVCFESFLYSPFKFGLAQYTFSYLISNLSKSVW